MSSRRAPLALALLSQLVVLLALPAITSAHTELAASDPADGSVLEEPPTEVVLTFEGEVDEAAAFTVTSPSGEEVGTGSLDLDIADRNVVRGDVSVAVPGTYVVAWTVTGQDGHAIAGEVSFSFAPEATVETPNTAVATSPASAASGTVVVVGLLLLLMAGVLLGRTAARP